MSKTVNPFGSSPFTPDTAIEVSQTPAIPSNGGPYPFPSEYCFGEEWICSGCIETFDGKWDGSKLWRMGKCDWCQKRRPVIKSYHAGWPDHINPPNAVKELTAFKQPNDETTNTAQAQNPFTQG